jgi:Fe-S oxidoreductase
MEDHEVLVSSLANYRNPYLSPRRDRARWAKGLDLPTRGEVLYFAGCSDSYVHPDVARRTVSVLRALGLDVAYLGADEPCCGSTATRLGLDEPFADLATDVEARIAASGAKTVVTACPGCSSAFREYYPRAGHDLGVKVVHLTELLDAQLSSGGLDVKTKLPGRYAWYDPCHLGRVDGVFEPPRRVLAACVENRVELGRHHAESLCCGSGGGLKTAFPDQATAIGGRVVDLATEADVAALVTACPWCETNIGDAAAGQGASLEVMDLSEVVFRALGLDTGPEDARRRGKAPGRLSI